MSDKGGKGTFISSRSLKRKSTWTIASNFNLYHIKFNPKHIKLDSDHIKIQFRSHQIQVQSYQTQFNSHHIFAHFKNSSQFCVLIVVGTWLVLAILQRFFHCSCNGCLIIIYPQSSSHVSIHWHITWLGLVAWFGHISWWLWHRYLPLRLSLIPPRTIIHRIII